MEGAADSVAGAPDAGPPPPVAANPACVLSADCPSGTYCDLGECTQGCNTSVPCAPGLVCSPRGRCLPPETKDTDPLPTGKKVGSLEVIPKRVELTERDRSFDVQLRASTPEKVRFRVQLEAPHLRIDEPRGEFVGSTTLTIRVDSAALKGRDVAGSLKVFTTLGDGVVDAPIHVGLTGTYTGALRYDGGPASLGDARIALDMREDRGAVQVRLDSKSSLLFPATSAGETTGRGSYTESGGLDFTVSQVVPADFGGERNHFARTIGRRVRFLVKSTGPSHLEGRFEETIFNLYSTPTVMTGTAFLDYRPRGRDPQFTLGEEPRMPEASPKNTFLSPTTVFGWAVPEQGNGSGPIVWLRDTCLQTLNCVMNCDVASTVDRQETAYAAPLNTSMVAKTGSKPFEAIADACKASLATKRLEQYAAPAQQCGLVPPLACSMQLLARESPSNLGYAKRFGRLVSEVLAPSILVAKNEIVVGLSDSFASGPASERARYEAATKALGPAMTWVLQPSMLEYLRSMPPEAAKGDDPGMDPSTQRDSFASARSLADAFLTSAKLDGERARISAASASGAQPDAAADAQRRAVLTYLEGAALSELLRTWRVVPKSVTVKLHGVLKPIDQGYGALLQGANAFGWPQGFVPFVYRGEDVGRGATNFEQMLHIAGEAVALEKNIEGQFLANKRQYETNARDLQAQLAAVRTQFDLRIREKCGSAFSVEATTDAAWAACSKGEVGVLFKDVDLAFAKVAASSARIKGMRDKIEIDTEALAAKQKVHAATLSFIAANGQEMAAAVLAEGVLSSMQKFIDIASNAQLFNAGAPVAMAAPAALIELEKSFIEVHKQQLQVAQTMRFEEASKQIELIQGMADIKKQVIDLCQLGVEIGQDLLGVTMTTMRLRNTIDDTKALSEERGRALYALGKDPANDPSFRLLRDQYATQTLDARANAQSALFLAGKALEYELNQSLPIEGAILNAFNATNLEALQSCMSNIHNGARVAYGAPQDYVTTVSVRRLLGILGARKDDVTGEELSEGQQFRYLLLRNENLDGRGGVGVQFATNLQPSNGLWSSDVCNDHVTSMQVQLVGDFLGDNQAQANIAVFGSGVLRACDADELRVWSIAAGTSQSARTSAIVQAGVNSFGDAPPNTSLFGQPVARATWQLVIPGGADAPSNADLDITKVDDIVLRIAHKANARRASAVSTNTSCLANFGR